jgi:cellulose synthase/poly-beta-1,6-N-acetylglucosamine synthase-like glycosyltransferase
VAELKMVEFLCWLFVGLILYTYVGYPLLLFFLTIKRKHSFEPNSHFEPQISIVIAAHNEESVIREKLDNSLQANYPADNLDIVVVSDGSTDATNEIVEEYKAQGVRLINAKQRSGKTGAQNIAVLEVDAEIIVFSDANAMYAPNALRQLVRHFEDPDVGCVCGELRYNNNNNNAIGIQEDLYWSYERFLKRREDLFGSILGANGSIYAVRKSAYIHLPTDIISDFIEPLKIIEKGFRIVYEPEAVSVEATSDKFEEEFQRKKRIILRSIHSLYAVKSLLNPFKRPRLSLQLISHKILRWFVPFLMLGMFVLNTLLLEQSLYQLLFIAQIIFYTMAFIGYKMERKKVKSSFLYIPFYLITVNYAALLSILDFVRGRNVIAWQPARPYRKTSPQERNFVG